MWDFITERRRAAPLPGYQHLSLVIQCVAARDGDRRRAGRAPSPDRNPKIPRRPRRPISAVGLTIPSFALLGLLIPLAGIGTATSVVAVTFYATLPILRNAVVGLAASTRRWSSPPAAWGWAGSGPCSGSSSRSRGR